MKKENIKKSKKFEPIVFMIQTKEEALCLWHRLNVPGNIFNEYLKNDYPKVDPDILNNCCELWENLDEILHPYRKYDENGKEILYLLK